MTKCYNMEVLEQKLKAIMDEIPKTIMQCMYCNYTQYTPRNNIEISHGVCQSPLCRLELALDTSLEESEIEHHICWYIK